MVGEWHTLTLGDLGRIVTGKTPLTAVEENFGGNIPFVTPSDMDGRKTIHTTARNLTETGASSISGSKIPAGSVMVSCIGSDMGKAVIAGRNCVTNQQINSIVVDDRFSSEFVYYNLSTRKNEIRHQAAGGSAQPILNKSDFSRLGIILPPLAEQKAIAAVLGALDDKIELNRRMNATLESMARALFQSWFVDFDPVRAKLDGRHPPNLDPATAALFPDSFEHTEEGQSLPRGWFKTKLGKEVQFQTGFTFKSEFFTEHPPGIRLARGMNVKEGEFFWSSQSRFWSEITPELVQYQLQAGDVLLGMDGSKVGKNWVRVRTTDLPCLLVQRVARLRQASSIGENFIWITVSGHTFRNYVESVKTGTSIPHISGGQIKGFEFVRPARNDNRILERFESITAPMSNQVDKNHSESHMLSMLRDVLLPKLLSGEVSTKDAIRIVEGQLR